MAVAAVFAGAAGGRSAQHVSSRDTSQGTPADARKNGGRTLEQKLETGYVISATRHTLQITRRCGGGIGCNVGHEGRSRCSSKCHVCYLQDLSQKKFQRSSQVINIKPHTSHLTPHTSHLTPHTSHLEPHKSRVKRHKSPARGLVCLQTPHTHWSRLNAAHTDRPALVQHHR